MLLYQGRIPIQHRPRALEKARDAYNVLYEEQEAQLDHMPLHLRGKVLAGDGPLVVMIHGLDDQYLLADAPAARGTGWSGT